MNNKFIASNQIFMVLLGVVSMILLTNMSSATIGIISVEWTIIPMGIIGGIVGGFVGAATAIAASFPIAGWIVGILIVATTITGSFQDTVTQTATFTCESYVAPLNSNDCESCNELGDLCSAYKCENLGSCTFDENDRVCYVNNAGDMTAPLITINSSVLTSGYKITQQSTTSGGGAGFYKIKQLDDKDYVNATDILKFGFYTDEPARCKISLMDNYEEASNSEMLFNIGGNSRMRYNFVEKMSLFNANTFYSVFDSIEQGFNITEINLYIWCADGNGNRNAQPLNIQFNLDPTPDLSAPSIQASSVNDGTCVSSESPQITLYIMDASPIKNCRWDRNKMDYEEMDSSHIMQCASSNNPEYQMQCSGTLNSVASTNTTYYFACIDSQNNSNKVSGNYELTLRTGSDLKLSKILPKSNTTYYGRALTTYPVELEVETLQGCNRGRSVCSYKNLANSYTTLVPFKNTNAENGVSSTGTLYLSDGKYNYFIECEDEAGHTVNATVNFTVDIDMEAPIIARIYEDEGNLNIITSYDSNCSYTTSNCDFEMDEGISIPYSNSKEHVLAWDRSETYYVKCVDYGSSTPADCSTIVVPTNI